jgi:hypothetical protein
MAGTKEDAVTDAVWSGKMSAPDHNNQFPCALLRTGFRFAFAQSAVLKGALFRKQRGQESQVRLTIFHPPMPFVLVSCKLLNAMGENDNKTAVKRPHGGFVFLCF